MKTLDLSLRGGTLVTTEGERPADLGVAEGRIVSFDGGAAREEIDARGLHIFPGLIDSHVHFNDPGRAHWEGMETGSRALAAGGGTMFFDMPLNSSPPTLDAASFDEKWRVAQNRSWTDFAFWGGLVPGNLDKLDELAACGVIGFKAFMANSGMEDFPLSDDATLREGMRRAARLGRLVAVHAESERITSELARRARDRNRISIRDYLDSRPLEAELNAIRRAIEIAGETNCALHIVHVSSGAGVARVTEARRTGVDVTCETCPHYLVLTKADMEHLGAVAKCAPPLRSRHDQDSLWEELKGGAIATVGSDHSPAPPELKQGPDFFQVWGGISGVQQTLPLLLTEGAVQRGLALELISKVTSLNVADRFNLPRTKGRLAIGADADLALVDLKQPFVVRADGLFDRHRQSPYLGRALTGRVVRTILRGQTIFQNDRITSPPTGRLVRPATD